MYKPSGYKDVLILSTSNSGWIILQAPEPIHAFWLSQGINLSTVSIMHGQLHREKHAAEHYRQTPHPILKASELVA
ncbi:hypothetical protein JOF39_000980 [Glutamicibacter protophormiae]|uniref:Uncharacterized protein n=1 Tax=Glutamicibacter protophormiae TaxID=37930 RepID=A0ABS4XN11_GLUPR|nr:hypothetical protein [Glutamicibacter protophormiae]